MDQPRPYTKVGPYGVQLGGDAQTLGWFRDGVLDFVYSSHLLEDFADTESALREWLRVLKPGGKLVLFCPDEQVYRRHCAATGQPLNPHHVHAEFSLRYIKHLLPRIGHVQIIHEDSLVNEYSWELVVVKRF